MTLILLSPDAPIVDVQYGDETVTCTSDANPEANKFVIIVNGTADQSPLTCVDNSCTLPLPVDYDTDVRCNVTNDVGSGSDTTVAIPGRCTDC